ncbi:MAG: ABC transporter substrate-binding protein [Chloroflexi bacterium]|nr:ABC transporter substrate-binding protein [Chloroflexota bacterium]
MATARLSRRRLLQLACVSASAVALAACGGAAAPAAPATSSARPVGAAPPSAVAVSTAAKLSAAPNAGGTMRVGMVGDLTSLDGQQAIPAVNSTIGWAYETLTRYGDKLQPQPQLAERWDVSADGKQIQLSLRKGVQFHDGREFTADDVVYSFNRLKDPKLAAIVGQIAAQAAWWTGIDAADKYTVVLKSDAPRPGVFDFLQFATVIDKNLMDSADAKTKVNGTGPFQFVEWVPGDHVTMARNKNYWQSGAPLLDGFRTSILRDAQAMVAQLEAGAIDIADSPALTDVLRLKVDPAYQALVITGGGSFVAFVANTTAAPMDNKAFRQAINFAIDRQRFVDTVFKGLVPQGQDLPFPPQSPAYDATKNALYTHDLTKAQAKLKEAALTSTDFDLVYSNAGFGAVTDTLAQILQADLAQIGVKMTLRGVDSATYLDMNTKHSYKGMALSSASGAQLAEATSLFTRSRYYSPDPKGSFSGFDDPRYRQLIDMAAAEPDATRRMALYSQIDDVILDDSVTMAVSLYPNSALARANVRGLAYDFRPQLTYQSAWLA